MCTHLHALPTNLFTFYTMLCKYINFNCFNNAAAFWFNFYNKKSFFSRNTYLQYNMHTYNLALCMYFFLSFLCSLNKLNRNLHTKKEMWWDWSFHFAKRILHCHEKVQIYAVFTLGISTSFFLLEFPTYLKIHKRVQNGSKFDL